MGGGQTFRMRIQYGHFLTFFAVIAVALASSVEDVLGGISPSQLDNILGDLDYLQEFNGNSDYNEPKNYDYGDYSNQPPHVIAQKSVDGASDISRQYQAGQKCICDTEHMFDCPEENSHRGE